MNDQLPLFMAFVAGFGSGALLYRFVADRAGPPMATTVHCPTLERKAREAYLPAQQVKGRTVSIACPHLVGNKQCAIEGRRCPLVSPGFFPATGK